MMRVDLLDHIIYSLFQAESFLTASPRTGSALTVTTTMPVRLQPQTRNSPTTDDVDVVHIAFFFFCYRCFVLFGLVSDVSSQPIASRQSARANPLAVAGRLFRHL
jgi:ABC-type microcin C transport system permease subunit YejE